jgi:hypothetical protein
LNGGILGRNEKNTLCKPCSKDYFSHESNVGV